MFARSPHPFLPPAARRDPPWRDPPWRDPSRRDPARREPSPSDPSPIDPCPIDPTRDRRRPGARRSSSWRSPRSGSRLRHRVARVDIGAPCGAEVFARPAQPVAGAHATRTTAPRSGARGVPLVARGEPYKPWLRPFRRPAGRLHLSDRRGFLPCHESLAVRIKREQTFAQPSCAVWLTPSLSGVSDPYSRGFPCSC